MHAVDRRKWRPGLWAVILVVLGLVLCLPIAGLFLFRFYANQLVQQTEESLLMQAAVLTAAYEQLYRHAADLPDTPTVLPTERNFQPLFPSVTMNPQAILPPRPNARTATEAIGVPYAQIGPQLSRMALRAQEQTLAGYRFLDRHGTVIGGSAEGGAYLGHVNEVALALNGDVASVARTRVRESGERVLYTLSQGSRVRIFVAMPAMVDEDIIGVVYISRTPNHIFRFLYGERWNLVQAAAFVLFSTGLIGFVFWRFVSQPLRALIRRTDAMDGASKWEPLEHYGTREVETLARSFQALTERLHQSRDTLTTYTAHVSHEMKSPLTSIKGAAELMQDDMPPETRARFLDNIRNDAARIEDLLARMRDYSAVGATPLRGKCRVSEVVPLVEGVSVTVTPERATAPIPGDVLTMVLTHLLENAAEHGAQTVQITVDATGMTITDDGAGISEGNRARVFEPFFTTRRRDGGTGMGLNIVRSGIEATGGAITLEPSEKGTRFRISFTR
ncbi:sensor histidine kinase [Rhodobacteraceae bacterium N5(2021)]|uniref:histidine kinase n=1 Tax=Gymnodinialimonas phycosphaerae TaxID=2841589 RepID=A0A975YEJ5_9RHOB|nr:ATP-binding protein [Gymnodinialimonas phycosphaerae]MBY4893673.1 sensor histidine kinase [Gymnodinialimonas phycosphaerae]